MAFNAERFDTKRFIDGSWVKILGGDFKVAKAGNHVFEKAREDSGLRKLEDPEEQAEALAWAVATGILKDWKDVNDRSGNPIPYSVDHAKKVLLDRPDLLPKVLEKANDLKIHDHEDVAQQTKKPKTTSDS